jgi:hypothetical protein
MCRFRSIVPPPPGPGFSVPVFSPPAPGVAPELGLDLPSRTVAPAGLPTPGFSLPSLALPAYPKPAPDVGLDLPLRSITPPVPSPGFSLPHYEPPNVAPPTCPLE